MGKKSRIKAEKAEREQGEEGTTEEVQEESEEEIRYAGVSDRFFAAGLDLGFLYFIIVPVSNVLFPLIFADSNIVDQAYAVAYQNQPELRGQPDQVMSFIIAEYPDLFREIMQQYFTKIAIQICMIGAFIIPFIHFKGATPGKMIVGIRVLDSITMQKLTLSQSVIRFLSYIPSAGVFGIGVFWANFNKRRRTWHDYLADSVVIIDENRWYKRIWDKLLGKE